MMGFGSIEIAERKAAQRAAPVYLYNFGYKSEAKVPGTDYPMGTPHAADIAFKFNNVETPGPFSGSRPERLVASRNMAELWTTFARTGRPAAAGQPAWPAYDLIAARDHAHRHRVQRDRRSRPCRARDVESARLHRLTLQWRALR